LRFATQIERQQKKQETYSGSGKQGVLFPTGMVVHVLFAWFVSLDVTSAMWGVKVGG
jgi:hypothetical protein